MQMPRRNQMQQHDAFITLSIILMRQYWNKAGPRPVIELKKALSAAGNFSLTRKPYAGSSPLSASEGSAGLYLSAETLLPLFTSAAAQTITWIHTTRCNKKKPKTHSFLFKRIKNFFKNTFFIYLRFRAERAAPGLILLVHELIHQKEGWGGERFNKIFFRGFNKSRPLWHSLSFGYFHNSDSCSLGNYSDQRRSKLKEFFCVFFAKSFPFKVWIKLTFRRETILFYI